MADKYYIDTSALLPLFRNERNSKKVQEFFLELDPPALISSLTKVEFMSAIARWVRMNDLTEVEAGLIENALKIDIKSGLFISQSVSTSHFNQAERWISIRRTSLRTLDALHLAVSFSIDAELITCDKILHQSAESFGVRSRLIES